MPDMRKLDQNYRLTPWSMQEHADYVAGRYGSLLDSPHVAEEYRQGYVDAEAKYDEAMKHHQSMLDDASKRSGEKPQKLVLDDKLDWDPRKRFGIEIEEEKAKKEAKKKEEEKAKKSTPSK